MWGEIAREPALWGFLGSFVYAAPRLSACAFTAKATGEMLAKCAFEAVVALGTGAIAAAAFAPSTANALGAPEHLNAVAAMLGLIANPTAPKLIESLSGLVSNILSGEILKIFKGKDQ